MSDGPETLFWITKMVRLKYLSGDTHVKAQKKEKVHLHAIIPCLKS